jgi:hypothetical protein
MYTLSRDYEVLYDLLQKGMQPVCFIDYRFMGDEKPSSRDVCLARKRTYSGNPDYWEIEFRVRGTGYLSYGPDILHGMTEKEAFIKLCTTSNIEFIDAPVKESRLSKSLLILACIEMVVTLLFGVVLFCNYLTSSETPKYFYYLIQFVSVAYLLTYGTWTIVNWSKDSNKGE